MDLGVLRVLHAHKEDAGLVTECLRVLIYLARDVRNRVTVHGQCSVLGGGGYENRSWLGGGLA